MWTTLLKTLDRDRPASTCASCESYGLCAVDCPSAPWDGTSTDSMFILLLRQRRWFPFPLPLRSIFWIDPKHQWIWDRRPRRD